MSPPTKFMMSLSFRKLKQSLHTAVRALTLVEMRGLSERLALQEASRKVRVRDLEVLRFAHRLLIETVRRLNLINLAVSEALKPVSLNELKPDVRSFLKVYAYAVLFGDGRPHAYARAGRSILGAGEVSRVEEALGRIRMMDLDDLYHDLSDEERVALETCMPTWFVRYCFRLFGRHTALRLLEAMSRPTPIYVRVNTLRTSGSRVVEECEREGLKLVADSDLPYLYRVVGWDVPPVHTRAYRRGHYYIQDKSSCLAVEVADPKPFTTVLDVCAAPGGKTTLMAQRMKNRGVIVSVDYSDRRMRTLRVETRRMGVTVCHPVVSDAVNPLPVRVEADLVLIDPPCTSTGAFGRRPSAKWRITSRSPKTMSELQYRMLETSSRYVKKGGVLVYSTCSVTVEENELVVERFLKDNPNFELEEATPRIGVPGLRGLTECMRLYPHLHECNGFFVAKMVRKY